MKPTTQRLATYVRDENIRSTSLESGKDLHGLLAYFEDLRTEISSYVTEYSFFQMPSQVGCSESHLTSISSTDRANVNAPELLDRKMSPDTGRSYETPPIVLDNFEKQMRLRPRESKIHPNASSISRM